MACSPRAARSSSAFGERSDSRIPGLAAVAASTICRVARLRMRAFVDVQHSESRPPPGGRQALARCPRRQLRLCVHRTKRRPCRRALLARLRRDDRQVCPSLPCSRCAPTGTPLARSASRSRRSWGRDALGGSACGAARARAHASPCLEVAAGLLLRSAIDRHLAPERTIWQPLAALATKPSRPLGRRPSTGDEGMAGAFGTWA
jgi:hypothetical protein